MPVRIRTSSRAWREVAEIGAQSLGVVALLVGLFLTLPIGPALIVAGAMLLTVGIGYELSGGGARGSRTAVQQDDDE